MVQCKLVVGGNSKVQFLSPDWQPKAPKRDTPDLFHSLPPELRNKIYNLILPNEELFFPPSRHPQVGSPVPALLMAAKYIRMEASPMYYGNNRFYFKIPDTGRSLERAVGNWRGVVATCGPRGFNFFQVWLEHGLEVEKANKGIYALVELIHDTGFEPDPNHVQGDALRTEDRERSIASGKTIFNTGRKHGGAGILGRAVALGRRARYEKWSKSRLANRMLDFMKVARSKRKKWPAWL